MARAPGYPLQPERGPRRDMRHGRRHRDVGLCLGIAALSVLVVFPAGVFAATASTRIKRVFYTAGAGEVNNLTIALPGTDYTLVDLGATITPAPACAAIGATATCPAAGVIGITVSADDGSDSVTNTTSTPSTLSGGDGNDSLRAVPGTTYCGGTRGSTRTPVAPATISSTPRETG